ncbi:MAG TPA: hypothetical protein VNJ01_04675 [Bacteriovoracaceae bacterium]|nr:hypothetical protein [Bacteriovoracaceae bacterium]
MRKKLSTLIFTVALVLSGCATLQKDIYFRGDRPVLRRGEDSTPGKIAVVRFVSQKNASLVVECAFGWRFNGVTAERGDTCQSVQIIFDDGRVFEPISAAEVFSGKHFSFGVPVSTARAFTVSRISVKLASGELRSLPERLRFKLRKRVHYRMHDVAL